jgi:hypothetical protein
MVAASLRVMMMTMANGQGAARDRPARRLGASEPDNVPAGRAAATTEQPLRCTGIECSIVTDRDHDLHAGAGCFDGQLNRVIAAVEREQHRHRLRPEPW